MGASWRVGRDSIRKQNPRSTPNVAETAHAGDGETGREGDGVSLSPRLSGIYSFEAALFDGAAVAPAAESSELAPGRLRA